MAGDKKTHKGRRPRATSRTPGPNPPKKPPKKPAPNKPHLRVVTPQPLLPDPNYRSSNAALPASSTHPDFSEDKTAVDPIPRSATRPAEASERPMAAPVSVLAAPPDRSQAKLLVIASLVSLIVIVLSLFVLAETMEQEVPKRPLIVTQPAKTVVKEVVKETGGPTADVMLNLDVKPEGAHVAVQSTKDGYRVRVSAPGYKSVTREISKGVVERIAIELEKAPPRPKKKRTKRPRRKKRRAGDVFLSGGDL